jgi:hypothetical protein
LFCEHNNVVEDKCYFRADEISPNYIAGGMNTPLVSHY